MTKWKATLDVLVKSLIPLFGTKTLLFNRDNKYEFKIVKEIETSLSKNKKIKLSNLCSHIRSSADLIHKVIKLRDDVVHFDKECLTPFHYRLSEQKLYQPNLIWENKQYKPQDFMLQTIEFLRDFIRDFMIYSINGSIAGMSLVIKDGSHQWYMPKNKLNTEK